MNISILSLVFDTLGTLMIAFAALKVHHRVLNEHKVDKRVFKIMKREQYVGVVGICLVLCSFVIELVLRSF